nr:uncharacterized protein LOC117990222 [Maniola hyperantus]
MELDEQRLEIRETGKNVTEQVTINVNRMLEEKFLAWDEKHEKLKEIVENQQKRIYFLEKQSRNRNIVFFGIEETETSYEKLESNIIKWVEQYFSIELTYRDVQEVKRVGKKGERPRPLVVTFSTLGTKIKIWKQRNTLKDTHYYVKEDYPKYILEKRKELQEQLQLEREKGNIANKNNKKTHKLHIATYNVRTLSTYERLLELHESLKKVKYDIIGISEMRRLGTKIEEYENFVLCHVGHTPGMYGVGFIVKKSHKHDIESFTGMTERVAVLNMNIQGFTVTIIQAYAPTETASEFEIEEFYKTIEKALEATHKNIIVMGDFNAKIGLPKKEEYLVMKQHGLGKRNERGQRLIDFAREHKRDTIERHLHLTGSTKKAYKELRTNKTWIEGLKKLDKNLNKRTDIITTATDFYTKLYSDKTKTDTTQNNSLRQHNEVNINPIEETEIIEAIKRTKLEKSPGSDNITNEALKIAYNILATPLANLFNLILQKSETPSQWSESNIILIYKKGDPKEIGNYRPISLLPTLYKLFSTIINTRISPEIEARQPVEQAGFRKGFSTVDHIHTLELIIEKYQEHQRPLYLAFIDYQKAFDTVTHASIWDSLKEQKVSEVYIETIRSIYNNNMGRIKMETLGPSFPIQRGVRQGDPLSPKIFIAILEAIISKLHWEKMGLYIQGAFLSHLRFADDIVILSETSSQLQIMIESLQQASTKVGLEINLSKTMTMTNRSKIPIRVNGNPLEYTENYIYLGKTISLGRKNNEIEVERRIQQTWNKYWSLKEIFKSNMPTHVKTRIMNSCLLPVLTYGCQTWKYTTKIKHKITTCQRGLERSMLKIKKLDKIRHTRIRSITKATDALNYALKLKWKWAGHVARLKDQRWTTKVTLWRGPRGKRSRGRPLTRWEDEILRTAGPKWDRIAQDRDKWTSLEEAFTQPGVLT